MSWPHWPGGVTAQPSMVPAPQAVLNPAPNVLPPGAQYTPEQWAQMQQQNWQQWAQWQQQFQQWQQQYGAEYQKSLTAITGQGIAGCPPPLPGLASVGSAPPLPAEPKPPLPPGEPPAGQAPGQYPSYTSSVPSNNASYSSAPPPTTPAYSSVPPNVPSYSSALPLLNQPSNYNVAPAKNQSTPNYNSAAGKPGYSTAPPSTGNDQYRGNSGTNLEADDYGNYGNQNRNPQRFGQNQNFGQNTGGYGRNWPNQNNPNQRGFGNDQMQSSADKPPNLMGLSFPKANSIDDELKHDYSNKRSFNQSGSYGDAKRNKFDQKPDNRWSQNERWNEFPPNEHKNQGWNSNLPPSSKPEELKPNPEELTEAEKKFDKQFGAWEAQFTRWKEQNANHPDKVQYREYEKKWETWRAQLLERREQMRRKRLGLTTESPQPAGFGGSKPQPQDLPSRKGVSQFNEPDARMNSESLPFAKPFEQPNLANRPPVVSKRPLLANPTHPEIDRPGINRPPPNMNNEPLQFKKPPPNIPDATKEGSSQEPTSKEPPTEDLACEEPLPDNFEEIGSSFLMSSSVGGIPGLDLVKDGEGDDGDAEEESSEFAKDTEEKKGPDFDAISRGINNILGDQKLMSMLSMVSQNQNIPTAASVTSTTSKMGPEAKSQPTGDNSNYGGRDAFVNFDDQTRSSFGIPNEAPLNRFSDKPPQGPFGQNAGIFNKDFGKPFPMGNQNNFALPPPNFGKGPGGYDKQSDRFDGGYGNFANQGGNLGRDSDNFGKDPVNFGRGPDNFGRGPNNFGRGPENFGRGLNNFGRSTDNFDRTPDNFPRGPDNFARGPDRGANNFAGDSDNFGKGPDNFGRGPANFGKGLDNFGIAPDSFGKGSDNFGKSDDNFGKGPNNFGRSLENVGRGPDNFGRGAGNFGRASDNFGRGVGNFGRGPDHFGKGDDNFGKGRDNFGQGHENVGRGPDHFGRGAGLLGRAPADFSGGLSNFGKGPNTFNSGPGNFDGVTDNFGSKSGNFGEDAEEFDDMENLEKEAERFRDDTDNFEEGNFGKPDNFSSKQDNFGRGPKNFVRGWKDSDNFGRAGPPANFGVVPPINFGGPSDNFDRPPPDKFGRGSLVSFGRGSADDFGRDPPANFAKGINDSFGKDRQDFSGKPPPNFPRGLADDYGRDPPANFGRGPPANFNKGPLDNFSGGSRDFGRGPNDKGLNFRGGPTNFMPDQDNFNRGPHNVDKGFGGSEKDNFDSEPTNDRTLNNKNKPFDNFGRGNFDNNFEKRPENFNIGLGDTFSGRPNQLNRGPSFEDNERNPNFEPAERNWDRGDNCVQQFDAPVELLQNVPATEELEIWKPEVVTDYEHKSQKQVEIDVILEPIQAFDYRHKPVNRIPYPQRPKWLCETLKNYREFDPVINRQFEPQQLRRYPNDRFEPRRSQKYEDRNYESRNQFDDTRPSFDRNKRNFDEPFDERMPNDDRKQFGSRKAFDDRKSFDDKNLYNDRKSRFEERKSFADKRDQPFDEDRKPFGERKSFDNRPVFDDKRPFDERQFSDDRKIFDDQKSFDDRKSFGERMSFDDRKGFDDNRSFDDRQFCDDRKSFDDRKVFDDRMSFDDRKPFDNRKSFDDRKSFDERKSFDDRKPYGERMLFDDRKGFDNRKPFDDRQSFDGRKRFDGRKSFDNKPYDRASEDCKDEDYVDTDNNKFKTFDEKRKAFNERQFYKEQAVSENRFESDKPFTKPAPSPVKSNVTLIEDLLNAPGRLNRAGRIVIILRGPPGSGKTFLAKLIKDKEVENGGSAPRILSLDDYFMVEQEKEVIEDGKKIKIKDMIYEYEECMEASYRQSLMKAFKKTITDGYFPFIIVDNVNDKVKYFGEMWSYAKQNGFQVYVCQLELDVQTCTSRNIHGRTEAEIEKCVKGWEVTPKHHPVLDATNLIQSGSIPEVEMEEINSPRSNSGDVDEEQLLSSKWDSFDYSGEKLAKLDGTNKPLRPSRTMEDYLQLDDDWVEPVSTKPGQKRVRWADLEERKEQEKMRAIGFVVGQTDWKRMMDPTMGSAALTKTKYINRVGKY